MNSNFAAYLTEKPAALPVPPDRPAGGPWAGNLLAILARIEEAVETETAGIRSDPRFDVKASTARKSRHLYELSKATRGLAPGDLQAEHRAGLLRLRDKLAANEAALRAHMSAVGEVAQILQNAIQGAEGDGTYSAAAGWTD